MRISTLTGFALAMSLGLVLPSPARAAGPTIVDFESFTGPDSFGTVDPPLHVKGATFTGGEVLTAVSNLPANRSTVYGTASFCSGCLPAIGIHFNDPVTRLRMQVMNGETSRVRYTVIGANGQSVTRVLDPNLRSGADVLAVPGLRITSVQVLRTRESSNWDFLIDDVRFVQL